MAYSVIATRNLDGIQAKTKQGVAKEIAQILRNAGIDVVDGLDPDEAVGRLPLSYFLLEVLSPAVIVGSYVDGSIDYLGKATAARYPRQYYLCHDDGKYASGVVTDDKYVSRITVKARPSDDDSVRLSIFYQEPQMGGRLVWAGDAVYFPMPGLLKYERRKGARAEIGPEIVNGQLRFILDGQYTPPGQYYQTLHTITDSVVLGTEEHESINQMLRASAKFVIETTGARIAPDYNGFKLHVPHLPGPDFLKPFSERLAFDVGLIDEETNRHCRPDLGNACAISPLGEEDLQEAIPLLRSMLDEKIKDPDNRRTGYYGYDDYTLYKAYVMVMNPAPKGERRPIGHIIIGVSDGSHFEYGELAIARTSINFEITDIYIRTSKNGVESFRRCNERTMTDLKGRIGDPKILKSTLDNAKNIRNRYAASAAIASKEDSESVSVSASTLRSIASLKFGADFVEWSYRMGYTFLADEICNIINSRRAWDRVTCMQDIIPGFVEGAKSLYTCLGMPKAWGKAAFDLCVKANGKEFGKSDIHDAALSLQIAWNLESALTNGKPSEASVPSRALEYAAIWREHLAEFGLSGGGGRSTVTREQWLFMAYENDPVGMAEAVRSYNRMVHKAIKLGLEEHTCRNYIVETFQAYCQLKAIGEDPEAHGVLFEYGLPEEDADEAKAMIERRCGAAQDVIGGYRSILDEKEHDVHEAKYEEHRKAMYWLECADREVSKDFVFKLPTKLYGGEDPLSLESEGRMQRNCVFCSFLNKLANGEYTIVLMRERKDPDSSLVTIGINRNMVIDQTYLARNQSISKKHGRAIKAWLAKVVSRGKGTLRMTTRPGGWNE